MILLNLRLMMKWRISEDEEKDGGSKGIDESLKARRKANIDYPEHTQKSSLKNRKGNHIQLGSDDESFEKLSDLWRCWAIIET